ncbi:hypothetical protein PQC55_gp119 [Escherichia phage vB_EcoP-CHD5UKE1]|uniref:Uncharacterized protein n=1 Tax=Escherichia phage vB_EcoP-CHD5UKE1 TaxID=2865805 RepID=A0ABX9AIT5_9CAUD|nr:hypothetical protein PQC55_gp119 [Escherichia phage vB_EcoP-CHD5UKE1]QZI80639.1 hypothetical protein CHD5UKE1_143 [Escherichia phage vB_EcoP-CHD5UKE1]
MAYRTLESDLQPVLRMLSRAHSLILPTFQKSLK